MSTNLETWQVNLAEVGAVYPFPGTETVLAIVAIATWIIWHVIQLKSESKTYEEDVRLFGDKEQLRKAMEASAAGTLLEELKVHHDGLNMK